MQQQQFFPLKNNVDTVALANQIITLYVLETKIITLVQTVSLGHDNLSFKPVRGRQG